MGIQRKFPEAEPVGFLLFHKGNQNAWGTEHIGHRSRYANAGSSQPETDDKNKIHHSIENSGHNQKGRRLEWLTFAPQNRRSKVV